MSSVRGSFSVYTIHGNIWMLNILANTPLNLDVNPLYIPCSMYQEIIAPGGKLVPFDIFFTF